MYSNANGYLAYQKNKYETASPHRLTLMLYTGAIKFVNQAELSLQEGDYIKAHQHLIKAQDIIYELMASLNEQEGGEVATNLKNLYLYINEQLVQANLTKSVEPILEVKPLLQSIKEAWEAIGKDVAVGS
ncbi:flagellar export chaperone FliS [Paenibacillus sp. MER TA 81-3]|uniref:flagellar export chaperone FliS n=1 Tax=Paenibacillus sp. MER TA 81-3 TaxID=2939573 RepID=UPI00204257A2|nr:flagellar export chaperone FliS [Paenibacillus sp. MER TA 81-3]MCM3338737.1 flagellar export chaperone FliS [Paenibacillus sp. MER TA 81-3]